MKKFAVAALALALTGCASTATNSASTSPSAAESTSDTTSIVLNIAADPGTAGAEKALPSGPCTWSAKIKDPANLPVVVTDAEGNQIAKEVLGTGVTQVEDEEAKPLKILGCSFVVTVLDAPRKDSYQVKVGTGAPQKITIEQVDMGPVELEYK